MGQLANVNLVQGPFAALRVEAVNHPVPGVPTNRYIISGFNTGYNTAANDPHNPPAYFNCTQLIFQDGPLSFDSPPNGVTVDAVLAVCADHLDSKQGTLEMTEEERMANVYLKQALSLLQNTQRQVAAPTPYQHNYAHGF